MGNSTESFITDRGRQSKKKATKNQVEHLIKGECFLSDASQLPQNASVSSVKRKEQLFFTHFPSPLWSWPGGNVLNYSVKLKKMKETKDHWSQILSIKHCFRHYLQIFKLWTFTSINKLVHKSNLDSPPGSQKNISLQCAACIYACLKLWTK